jgi:hypothetical protein
MKMFIALVTAVLLAQGAFAGSFRAVVLDFEDQTGSKPDPLLGGNISTAALATKGPMLLAQQLLDNDAFILVDRRDFTRTYEKQGTVDNPKPSVIHAAQILGADVILRGSLQSFSTSKRTVKQGGYTVEMVNLGMRIGIEALDAVDGALVAVVDGEASRQIRQTNTDKTEIGETDILKVMEEALAASVPELEQRLEKRRNKQLAQPRINIEVATSEDPAMIEIDGILVGTSPFKDHEIYKGDHVLRVTKPGYRTIEKRINFTKSAAIEIPMLRVELSADEMKEILTGSDIILTSPWLDPPLLIKDLTK